MNTTIGTSAFARLESATQLEVCRDCLDLRGPLGDWPNARVQRCRCESRGSLKEKRWRGFDFNVAFELCYLCAAEAIPSGSRWSSFYCAGCDRRVKGQALPLGRHALMGDAATAELAGEGSRVDRLRAWRQRRGRAILRGLPGNAIPLARYVVHARGFEAPALTELFDASAATSFSRRA